MITDKPSYIMLDDWKQYGVTAGMTTRIGGFSKDEPFTSFNMGRDTEDSGLKENYRKWLSDFSWEDLYKENRIFFTHQVHMDNIVIVDDKAVENNDSSRGHYGIDGFITNRKGKDKVVLTVITADCQSITLLDPRQGVTGILHSGWRGTRLRILHRALCFMKDMFDCKAEDILISLGPSINQENYQVSPEFKKYFSRNLLINEDRYLFDISGENRSIAIDFGIPENNIHDNNLCTYDNKELFFSHRRDKGITGRMLSFISMD
jgi:hypothetical protein